VRGESNRRLKLNGTILRNAGTFEETKQMLKRNFGAYYGTANWLE
jgi:hypothetical protein